jgi:hypothetical protein
MYVEAICPLCFASHVVHEDMRGEKMRCEECEEEFIISKKAKRTNKKPSRLREVKAAEDEAEAVTPVEAAEVGEVLPPAKLVDAPPKKARPRPEEEEVQEIPDDAVQGGAPIVKTTPPKRRREEDEEEDRPKKRRRQDDEDEDDRPRRKSVQRSGAPVGLIIGLSAGAVMLLGLCGIGGYFLLLSGDEKEPQQAQVNNPPANNGQPRPALNSPPEMHDPPKGAPPKNDPPKNDPPKVNPPVVRPPKVEPPKPDPLKPWNVKADPPAVAVKMPADFKKEIAAPGVLPEFSIPARPSPFVAIGSNRAAGDERQIWNLQTGEMTGKLVGQIQASSPPALSPDGAHLAFLPAPRRGTAEVWAPASGKMVTVQIGSTFAPILMEFGGPDTLLIGHRAGTSLAIKVFDPTTGREERVFNIPAPSGARDAVAVSPGGAYLAVIDRDALKVFDVKTGTLTGERPIPKAPGVAFVTCHGLSFSPDGAELAALFFGGPQAQLVCWDAVKGDVVSENTIPKAQPQAGWLAVYRGHVIDWVGDRRGWLLYGYTFVDRKKNGGATFLPEPPAIGSPVARHLIGPGHAVTMAAGAKPNEKVLKVSAFDPDKPQ